MRRRGVQLRLVSPLRWNEGGNVVSLDRGADDFLVPVRTLGHHPFLFVYDPRPLRRLLRDSAIDVLDVHEEPASLATFEIRVLRRIYRRSARLLLYSAQNIYKNYPPPFRWLERRALAEANAVYVPNTAAGEVLRRKGFKGIIRLLALGVDIGRFTPAGLVNPTRSLHVGYVGRLEEHKGVQVLLEAIAGTPALTLDVIGDGPYRTTLEALSRELHLSGRVRFLGFSSHAALTDAYATFDVVVIPSLPTTGWIEQFCRVAVEAMASGIPIVASASGSLPEVVGDAGLLIQPADVEALRSALCTLAADSDLRSSLAVRGRARSERFSWPAIADAHHQLYREVVA